MKQGDCASNKLVQRVPLTTQVSQTHQLFSAILSASFRWHNHCLFGIEKLNKQ